MVTIEDVVEGLKKRNHRIFVELTFRSYKNPIITDALDKGWKPSGEVLDHVENEVAVECFAGKWLDEEYEEEI